MRVTKTHFVFPARGGERSTPHGILIPESAINLAYDPEAMEITYSVPNPPAEDGTLVDPTPHTIPLSQELIDAAEEEANAPTPPAVPESVTKAQLKLALLVEGIDLSSLVAQLPADQQPTAQILIDDATEFGRAANMVATLGAIAGLTSEQIDALFIAAAQIDPASL